MDNEYNGRNGNGYQPIEPPKAPPMRVGDCGDTIDLDGVRRDLNGIEIKLRKLKCVAWAMLVGWFAVLGLVWLHV